MQCIPQPSNTSRMQASGERRHVLHGRPRLQFIEPVTFARASGERRR